MSQSSHNSRSTDIDSSKNGNGSSESDNGGNHGGCKIEMEYKVWLTFSTPGNRPFHYGPGDNLLLSSLLKTHNLTRTCKEIGISYKKAWNKIKQIEMHTVSPVVITKRGGAGGGGSINVTELGKKLILQFNEIQNRMIKIKSEVDVQLRSLRKDLIGGCNGLQEDEV